MKEMKRPTLFRGPALIILVAGAGFDEIGDLSVAEIELVRVA